MFNAGWNPEPDNTLLLLGSNPHHMNHCIGKKFNQTK